MFRKLSLTLAISAALSPFGAHALGLGEIATDSALNESFDAKINLLDVKAGELDDIKAQLATSADFAKAGLDRPYLLTKLIFTPEEAADGRYYIKVSTKEPVREPFLNFLIELNWPKGRLLREFTVLLDPPVTTGRRPPPIALAQVDAPRLPGQQPAMEETSAMADAGYYSVPEGATLWGIARQLTTPGESVQRVLMALYQANPQAFVNGDMNTLLAGSRLLIPADIQGIIAPGLLQQDRLRIATTAVAEGDQPQAAVQQGGDFEQVKTDLMQVRETSESTRQETDNLRFRIRELESQLSDIQQLLQLKDDQLAQMQQNAETASAATEAAAGVPLQQTQSPLELEPIFVDEAEEVEVAEESGVADEVSAPEEIAATQEAGEQLLAETGEAAELAQEPPLTPDSGEAAAEIAPPEMGQLTPEATPVQPTQGAGAAEPGVEQTLELIEPVQEQAPTAAETTPLQTTEPTTSPVTQIALDKPKSAPKPPPTPKQEEPGLLDRFMQDPTMMAAGAGGGIAILGLIWWLLRRRRSAEEDFQESVLISASDVSTVELEEDRPDSESRVNNDDDTSFISDFSPSDIDALQEETGEVDPAAEADVYIAYGRYQQAESLITQALQKTPEREDLQFKLLEIYFTTRNVASFVGLAEKMNAKGMPEKDADTWARVKSMGRELAPDNELFAGGEDSIPDGDEMSGLTEASDASDYGVDSDSEALANLDLDLDLDTGLSELDSGRLDSGINFRSPDAGSVLQPPPSVDDDSESSPLSDPLMSSSPRPDEADLDANMGSLDHMDLSELDLGEISVLREEKPSAPASTRAGESDSEGRYSEPLRLEDEISDLDLDQLGDSSSIQRPTNIVDADDDQPLSELLGDETESLEEEVDTKLDLAKAYVEMSDMDGAREILEEVLEEGSDQQKERAREIMKQLG